MTAKKMGKKTEIKDLADIENVNFIYANPVCRDKEDRRVGLDALTKMYGAKVIYDSRIGAEWVMFAEDKVDEQMLDDLKDNNMDEL